MGFSCCGVCCCRGWLLYGLSRSFWQLAVVEVVLGLSISAWSGTDAALLYETIAELGLDEQALHHESRNLFLSQATESLASVLGGYLAVWISLRATVWATAAPYAASLLLVGMLTEPTRRSSDQSATLRQAWGYLRDAFSDVELRRLMLGGGLLAAGTLVAVWLHQFLWLRADLARPLFGWSWAALNLAVAFSALVSPWLHERLGTRGALGLLGLWSAATFVGLGVWISPWVVVVGCALNLVRGVGHPIVVTGINQQVTDDRRATALSTYSLMARLIFVLFGPVVGWVAMAHGLTPACLLTCLLGIGAMLVVRPFSSKLST